MLTYFLFLSSIVTIKKSDISHSINSSGWGFVICLEEMLCVLGGKQPRNPHEELNYVIPIPYVKKKF